MSGRALFLLRQGKKLRRTGWNGKGMWVHLVPASLDSPTMLPFLMFQIAGKYVPWTISQTDALSVDWELVREEDATR